HVPECEPDIVQHYLVAEGLRDRLGEDGSGNGVKFMVNGLKVELISQLAHDVVDSVRQGGRNDTRLCEAIARLLKGSSEGHQAGSDAAMREFPGAQHAQAGERSLKPLLELVNVRGLEASEGGFGTARIKLIESSDDKSEPPATKVDIKIQQEIDPRRRARSRASGVACGG